MITGIASPSAKPIIGLAGGIGAGKSLVAAGLERLGAGVIDADRLARQALEAPEVRRQIEAAWGAGVLGEDGRVDRARLAAEVFGEPARRRQLESILHPRVRARREAMREHFRETAPVRAIVEDCPLLFETGLDRACDRVIFVDAPRARRLERLRAERGWDEAELDRREAAQWPLDMKVQAADYVLRNDADPSACFDRLQRLFDQVIHSDS